ncbi:MAG: NAD-binding protein [Acidimicrobiia bacterium]|jgi:putative NADH-flavin reductase
MPLIVVGADTRAGRAILEPHDPRRREVRVFVTDESVGNELRSRGFKVAVGDVSDESHVEAASTRCFSAVLIAQAATDSRERSFAVGSDQVLNGWASAVANSKVKRVIWVTGDEPPETDVAEVAVVSPDSPDLAKEVTDLDDIASLG